MGAVNYFCNIFLKFFNILTKKYYFSSFQVFTPPIYRYSIFFLCFLSNHFSIEYINNLLSSLHWWHFIDGHNSVRKVITLIDNSYWYKQCRDSVYWIIARTNKNQFWSKYIRHTQIKFPHKIWTNFNPIFHKVLFSLDI